MLQIGIEEGIKRLMMKIASSPSQLGPFSRELQLVRINLVYLITINKNSGMQLTPSKAQRVTYNHQNNPSQVCSELNKSYLTYQPYSGSPRHKPYTSNPSFCSHNSDKLSVPAFSTRKSSQIESSKTNMNEETHYNYEAIEHILKKQNKNLQQQNQLLLKQIQRLRNSNRKYKLISQNQKNEIEQLQEQCEAHKRYADQMKDGIMLHLKQLELKTLKKGEGQLEQSLVAITGASLNSSNANREE